MEDAPPGRPPGASRRPATVAWAGGLLGGVLAGAFGVGGGLVFVPVMTLLLGRQAHVAHATSLAAIVLPASVAAVRFAWENSVAWVAAAALTVGTLAGVALGTAVLPRLPERVLRWGFALLLAGIAVRFLIGGPQTGAASPGGVPLGTAALAALTGAGAVIGVESSVLGVSGGVLIVPLLRFGYGYSQHLAEGTALVVIIPTVLVGALLLHRNRYTDWRLGGRLGAGAVLGSVVGAHLAFSLDGDALGRGFGILLLVVAVVVAARAKSARIDAVHQHDDDGP